MVMVVRQPVLLLLLLVIVEVHKELGHRIVQAVVAVVDRGLRRMGRVRLRGGRHAESVRHRRFIQHVQDRVVVQTYV